MNKSEQVGGSGLSGMTRANGRMAGMNHPHTLRMVGAFCDKCKTTPPGFDNS